MIESRFRLYDRFEYEYEYEEGLRDRQCERGLHIRSACPFPGLLALEERLAAMPVPALGKQRRPAMPVLRWRAA